MIRSIKHIGEQEEKCFLCSEQNNKANTTIIQIQNNTLYQKSISVYYFSKRPYGYFIQKSLPDPPN